MATKKFENDDIEGKFDNPIGYGQMVARHGMDNGFKVEMYHQKLFENSRGIILSLSNAAISASDSHDDNHGPAYVKLGAAKVEGKSHAWCAKKVGDYLTIDLGTSKVITGVEIASRGKGSYQNQMVTKFNIKTSINGIHWTDQGDYIGVYEELTPVKRKLRRSVIASFIRITILESKNHPSMRVDVLVYG
eukprot:CAMPEP_0201569136 /NCGR_PEP_ID=MMETSP0190_2-20130828/10666_1 /ASSEMBLY_ACC=CAM_ASM_000263 /TAXON_ID=37353 /ORGANISM="Rosalina sp." /LENGTH=189 /DNA_ID=CAMNT_0047991133 /DNA_START=53 /DNA_END=622 /DNA_ORIENTATION=+